MTDEAVFILVVEDCDTLRFLVEKQLSKLGLQAHFAANGKEAVEQTAVIEYSLILMDIMMPVMDGFEAVKIIREQETKAGRKRSAIVAMTAYTDKKEVLEAGMDDYLFKPVMLEQLKAMLNQWLPDVSSALTD